VPDAILVGGERRAVAGLLELAVRRKVRLVAETSQRGRKAVGVELVDGAEFSGAETELLEALFGPGHPRERCAGSPRSTSRPGDASVRTSGAGEDSSDGG
jgi:hypothetical protein